MKQKKTNNMSNYFAIPIGIVVFVLSLSSCQTNDPYKGQLLGSVDRPGWQSEVPFGMVNVPTGSLHIGSSDQDVNSSMIARQKQVSIQGFYMDDTEITNNEYRQFVEWVRDAKAHEILGHYKSSSEDDEDVEYTDGEEIDWTQPIDWDDPETKSQLEEMYFSENQSLDGHKELDFTQYIYEYKWEDMKSMAKYTGDRRDLDRSEYFVEESAFIYPDELVWVRDFTYSYNEPMARNYFKHPAFDDYPVVGVTWYQANAFCAWRSQFWKDYKYSIGEGDLLTDNFRLPTEHEWEYAARGGRSHAQFPWGGPYVRNAKGCVLANFKPSRGNYAEDGGFYTVKANAYWPNDYGLYNMAGNVSEWTSSAFYENAYSFIMDMNPDIKYNANELEPDALKRKVIRGGSWKDIAYFIQTGTRDWEYADVAKSSIGFRTVTTLLGRN